jgi:DNA-binding NtrC family response regulator
LKINKHILVIDDDVYIRRVVELKLKNAGYQVLVAGNGEEGMKIINAQLPDAIITDVEMPNMDGRAVIEKTNKFKKEHPFITLIVSCSIGFQENQWINEMEDTYFMEKPFSLNKILECMDKYFGIER